MDSHRILTPCLIGTGTLANPRDMVRAMETIEALDYTYTVDSELISEGRVTLVKIMADAESATILLNGCLFLNVMSFTYLNFFTDEEGVARFELHCDGTVLGITPVEEPELRPSSRPIIRLMEDGTFDTQSFVTMDDDEDEE
ncbi:MAG: hypothetical protein JXE06_03170 [Coriobacteriia bacterium]|nr:hypothetical protein [Coriobacteriia bacterium]MBN2823643.1 hypothetical protein [Coriobacteriia bacterium]